MATLATVPAPYFPSEHINTTTARSVKITEHNGGLRVQFCTGEATTAYTDCGYDTLGSVGWDVTAWVEMRALPKGARKL